jgi:hypothetical protein
MAHRTGLVHMQTETTKRSPTTRVEGVLCITPLASHLKVLEPKQHTNTHDTHLCVFKHRSAL